MDHDIRLYIQGQMVELSSDPKILINAKEKDLHNPTTVKNSFSKQITLDGTPTNNNIFSNIWNLEYTYDGTNFNPATKTGFELFVDGDLFQKGYVKLDKINRTNTGVKYAITLYGNLGQFLHNLAYVEDSGEKKTLASLRYQNEYYWDLMHDFNITKENVDLAWEALQPDGVVTDEMWKILNFIPAYNGYPSNMDANKALINYSSNPYSFVSASTVDNKTYLPILGTSQNIRGFGLGETSQDLTEWQTRDLRSYNQRPIISMKSIIDACCLPENNGGFEVDLDSHFFNSDNPYYNTAWMTLPMLNKLNMDRKDAYNIDISRIDIQGKGSDIYLPLIYNSEIPEQIRNTTITVNPVFTTRITTGQAPEYLYPNRKYLMYHDVTVPPFGLTLHYSWYFLSNAGVCFQFLAVGANNEVLETSKAYYCGNKFLGKNETTPWEEFWHGSGERYQTPKPEFEYIEGIWKLKGDVEDEIAVYEFVDSNDNPINITATFKNPTKISRIFVKSKQPTHYYMDSYTGKDSGRVVLWEENSANSSPVYLYSQPYEEIEGTPESEHAVISYKGFAGNYYFQILNMYESLVSNENFFSGERIKIEKLLSTQYTPADYLLSYCKLFGLYMYYDPSEVSSNQERYPSGVVHIMDRDTFYTDEVVNISNEIDWSKNVEIIPSAAATKWYKFDVEHTDAELDKGYKEEYGKDYGQQLVNTNYEFDDATTNLYDGNAFRNGISALEKDKFYKYEIKPFIQATHILPVYYDSGFKYSLFNNSGGELESTEIEYPWKPIADMENVNPFYNNYDAFPKLQLHGQDNSPIDGDNILVFYRGTINTLANYWISDDLAEMNYLNNNPCWLLTASELDASGRRVAIKRTILPVFTRDLTAYGQYGNIIHSWNFGHPQLIYSPETYTTQGDSLYDKCWYNYIGDLFNKDSRKVTCYVKTEHLGRNYHYWFRRFYWFENSIWVLNEIKDLNPASHDTVKMEFIKVQDMNNYKLPQIRPTGDLHVVFDSYIVDCGQLEIDGVVYLQSGIRWLANSITGVDGRGNTYSISLQDMVPSSGSGNSTRFTISLPQNTGDTAIIWTLSVTDGYSNVRESFIQQSCTGPTSLEIIPSTTSVGSTSGIFNFTVLSEGVTGISYTSEADWFTITETSGGFSVIYDANTGQSRTAVITATGQGTGGAITATTTITQEAGEYIIIPEGERNLTIDWFDTDIYTINLQTNTEWTSQINDNQQ